MSGPELITSSVCSMYCRWRLLLSDGEVFCFSAFPEYLQIFPEGTLLRDVAPPVFKAQAFPGAPRQIIFLVSPAGKETPSLLGFGCHIIAKRC